MVIMNGREERFFYFVFNIELVCIIDPVVENQCLVLPFVVVGTLTDSW